jgi:hypothetical protein
MSAQASSVATPVAAVMLTVPPICQDVSPSWPHAVKQSEGEDAAGRATVGGTYAFMLVLPRGKRNPGSALGQNSQGLSSSRPGGPYVGELPPHWPLTPQPGAIMLQSLSLVLPGAWVVVLSEQGVQTVVVPPLAPPLLKVPAEHKQFDCH